MLHHKYQDRLKCLCFSPPGCVATKNVADQPYIVSYVLGSDVVPRLSQSSAEHLRDSVLWMIARTKIPKFQALRPKLFDQMTRYRRRKRKQSERSGGEDEEEGTITSVGIGIDDMLYGEDEIPESEFYRQVLSFWVHQEEVKSERTGVSRTIQLLPPGRRIVHMVRTEDRVNFVAAALSDVAAVGGGIVRLGSASFHGSNGTSDGTAEDAQSKTQEAQNNNKSSSATSSMYTAVWATNEDFLEIQLANSHLSDHFPGAVANQLEKLAAPLLKPNDSASPCGVTSTNPTWNGISPRAQNQRTFDANGSHRTGGSVQQLRRRQQTQQSHLPAARAESLAVGTMPLSAPRSFGDPDVDDAGNDS